MQTESALLQALAFDGEGSATPLTDAEQIKAASGDQLVWIHLDAGGGLAEDWLARYAPDLDSLIVEALLAGETRPRLLERDDGLLLILRGMNLNENSAPEDMVSIRLWITENRILSVRLRKLKAVSDIVDRLKAGQGPTNAGEFVAALVGGLFKRMEPVFAALDEALDDLEEQVMESPDRSQRSAVIGLRKQAIIFRRYIAPQREAISALRLSGPLWLSQPQRHQLQESQDQVIRYIEDIDALRERAQIVKDELSNALSDEMNRNLYQLSLITAIFLPLGFLTGLLGINVGGIPGAETPTAFWIFCGLLSLLVGMQLAMFRRLRWF